VNDTNFAFDSCIKAIMDIQEIETEMGDTETWQGRTEAERSAVVERLDQNESMARSYADQTERFLEMVITLTYVLFPPRDTERGREREEKERRNDRVVACVCVCDDSCVCCDFLYWRTPCFFCMFTSLLSHVHRKLCREQFVSAELVDHFSSTLNFMLVRLSDPMSPVFRVNNLRRYKLSPEFLLKLAVDVYINFEVGANERENLCVGVCSYQRRVTPPLLCVCVCVCTVFSPRVRMRSLPRWYATVVRSPWTLFGWLSRSFVLLI
jgi:Ubiquitin elongating factor core